MDLDVLRVITPILFGGGVVGFVTAIIKARPEARQINAQANAIGIKTDAEAEQVAMATMTTALQSAQQRIEALHDERIKDRDYYDGRIKELERRVRELLGELRMMEGRLNKVLNATEATANDLSALNNRNRHQR